MKITGPLPLSAPAFEPVTVLVETCEELRFLVRATGCYNVANDEKLSDAGFKCWAYLRDEMDRQKIKL